MSPPPPPAVSAVGLRGRLLRVLLAPWAVAAVVSFAAPAHEAAAHTGAGAQPTDPVHIPDANLRAKVEAALNKASGAAITHAEMAGLRTCTFANPTGCLHLESGQFNVAGRVHDLTGLEHATGLTRVVIRYHPISDLTPLSGLTSLTGLFIQDGDVRDLTPLAGLTNLQILRLDASYRISDLTPLSGLTSLRLLGLTVNRISDLTPLAGLTGLTRLYVNDNRISDLTPLSGLTSLEWLTLDVNRITNLEPLRGMTSLTRLTLQENHGLRDISPLSSLTGIFYFDLDATGIEDLEPLVNNSGLGSGDYVSLDDVPTLNAAAAGHVTTLRGRGVTVWGGDLEQALRWQVQNVGATPGPGRLTVTWDPLPDAENPKTRTNPQGYKVQWRSGAQHWSDTVTYKAAADYSDVPGMDRHRVVSGVNTTSYTIPGLTPGVAYTVRVKPDFGTFYEGRPSAEDTGIPQPDRVTGAEVTPGVESLAVSWNPVADADGYRVRWKSGDEDYSDTADPARHRVVVGAGTTSHTIPGLTPGVTHTVHVIATANEVDGPPSDDVTGTPRAPRPGRVTGVEVASGVGSLAVSWNPVADADGYRVQWKSGDEEYSDTADPPRHRVVAGAGTTSHTIPGLTSGVTYTMRVIATGTHAAGDGPPSDDVTGTPRAPRPGQVTGLDGRAGVGSLAVWWNPVADADGYRVQWKSGGEDYSDTADPARHRVVVGAGTTSHTIPGLTPGTGYTVRIIAVWNDSSEDAPASEEWTGTPLFEARVEDVAVVEYVEALNVSWAAVSYADGYRVRWKSGGEDWSDAADPARHRVVVGAGTTSYTIPDLTPRTEYTLHVVAVRAGSAIGPPSEEVVGTPRAVEDARVDVTVNPGAESLSVSWEAVSGADRYLVKWKSGTQEYSVTADPPRHRVVPAGSGVVTYVIPGLDPGVEYSVCVTPLFPGQQDGDPRLAGEDRRTPARRVEVSITDAVVVEGEAAELSVRLDEPSTAVVTVKWTTGDGTARAGEDYLAEAGSLTIQPGARMGAFLVSTKDDERVEPAETFRVRLTDAANAERDPEAASGTVTITDDDAEGARGRALRMALAGMGRWVAADAMEVIEERVTVPAEGARVALGGHALAPAAAGLAAGGGVGVHRDGLERPHAAGPARRGLRTRSDGERLSAADLLARSRFDLPLAPGDGGGAGGWRLWGQATAGRFDGEPEVGFRMDGEVAGGYLGLDYRPRHDTVAGVALAHSRGAVDYTIESVTRGEVDVALTSVLPWAHFSPRAGLGVWGLLGAGWGSAELKDEAGEAEADVEMRMAAAGLRREVASWREIDVALKADVFLTELETDAGAGLPKTAGDAERLRLRLEGRRPWEFSAVSRLTPSVEAGGRWDGGSAEKGLGLEVGGGLAYTHTGLGLEVEARARFLLAHRQEAFDERGGSVSVKLDPGQAGRGPWLTFAPGWGAEGSRAARTWDGARTFRAEDFADDAPELSPDRLALETGYGLATHGGAGLLTPRAGLSMAGSGARDYKLGARLEMGRRAGLGVEGRRSVRAGAPATYEIMLHGRLDW